MTIKLFEIRDEGTCIPAMAIYVLPNYTYSTHDYNLLRRAGWGNTQSGVYLAKLAVEDKCCFDPYSWADRTMQTAHLYIEKHFHELNSGSVIDVRYILGETTAPCASDLTESPTAAPAPDPSSH